jgi:hypothetical protein
VLSRVAAWTDSNIIDPKDIGPNPQGLDGVDPYSYALEKFLTEQSVFWKGWASSVPSVQNRNPRFTWGAQPVFAIDYDKSVGAVGGWGIGVYRYSDNPNAAVKLAKYLTNPDVQKARVLQYNLKALPTQKELLNDPNLCSKLGTDSFGTHFCQIYAESTPTVRPVGVVGKKYRTASKNISDTMLDVFQGTYIVTALTDLEKKLQRGLNTTLSNSTIDTKVITDKPKNSVSHLTEQVGGLFFIIFVTGLVVVLVKRGKRARKMEAKAAAAAAIAAAAANLEKDKKGDGIAGDAPPPLASIDGSSKLKESSSKSNSTDIVKKTAKINKSGFQPVAADDDLESGLLYNDNEEEEDMQGKKGGLAKLGQRPGLRDPLNESVRSFEKADFV